MRNKSAVGAPDLQAGLAELGLDGTQHVLAHASLRSFGRLEGGSRTLVDTLQRCTATLAAPAFTYSTMLYRPTDPVHARYHRDRRVSRELGRLPQEMVERAEARRSFHPTLSFVALGQEAEYVTQSQSLDQPYQPVGALYELDGYSLMIGTEWDSNTAVHYGEYLAGVPYLTRWAEVDGEVKGMAFPNCSADFGNLAPSVQGLGRQVQVGQSLLQLYPMRPLIDRTVALLERQPGALLCRSRSCRCQDVGRVIDTQGLRPRTHQVRHRELHSG
ncbi:AAC(3) family N-acetyltransferase [Deinococcus radiophilus]|uniref:Aminoglycoside N(3)-acetyltransferase n=1 Tax=Deinococcus radiophilus TaxID=32062 RepID=A0A431VZT4_9DEIO|nr:AAC(3) family N-acetyltransferase [Deinococcus radiophilus]RTR28623.1 aminoglycoside N(3)-acetyltransferase [Deinococcus radiophilus]UFA51045.1 AAC(3) family N-acetyltransferase [Deinococcus radiophilus]